MRTVTTCHLEPIRLFDWRDTYIPRSPLNVPLLITLLRDYLGTHGPDEDQNNVSVVNGKKRPLPHGSPDINPKRKNTISVDIGRNSVPEHQRSRPEVVPAFRHTYEFRYSTPSVTGPDAQDASPAMTEQLARQEEELDTILDRCRSSSESVLLDLGEVSTCIQDANVVVYHNQVSSKDTLLILPRIIDEEFDLQADDYRSNVLYLHDLMYCCHDLRGSHKIDISTILKVYCSPHKDDMDELPFRIVVEVTVSLVCPNVFQDVQQGIKVTAGLDQRQRRVLNYVFPPANQPPVTYRGDTDIPFLYTILGPAPDLPSKTVLEAVQPVDLLPTLLPFQRRSVAWMLKRERKIVSEQGQVVPYLQSEPSLFWEEVELDSHKFYLHRLKGLLSEVLPEDEVLHGGSLNEAPGLGKTVECIALILLNPGIGRDPSVKRWDQETKVFVRQVKTTLIVTPPALAPQWADELRRHSPSLKVFVYEGWMKFKRPVGRAGVANLAQRRQEKNGRTKVSSKSNRNKSRVRYIDDMSADDDTADEESEEFFDWCSYINTFDICLTTYNVLQQDLTVARPPPVRPRRSGATYTNTENHRSPLALCEWYRVMMDEVQMAGGGKTEEMVSLIPRISSFAISGTPAKSQISDLIHVLNFLRVKEIAGSLNLWKRLLKPNFVHHFMSLFNRYAIRTTRDCVQHELTIPTQTRSLVPIKLGRVERHVYDQTLEQALFELGCDTRGVAAVSGWQANPSLLRTWLRTLRGICTHPQVGQLQNQTDKLNKPGVLKTIHEVLEGMRDQNWRNLMDERKNRVSALTRYAQLWKCDELDGARYKHSLEALLLAEKEADQLVQDLKAAIADHDVKGDVLKKEAITLREIRYPTVTDTGKGKSRGYESAKDTSPVDNLDDLPKTPAGEEHAIRRRALQQRLRECYLVLHMVLFLKGDSYHVLGETHIADEDASYKQAEELRRNILKSTEESAIQAMGQMAQVTDKLTKEELLLHTPYLGQGGIRSYDLMEEANELIDEVLNAQTNLLWEWRTRLIALLAQNLSANSGDADGEEYSRTLDTQGEAETILQAYSALVADRREVMLAERTLLAAHDTREKNKRGTKTSKKAVDELYGTDFLVSITEDVELLPEHQVLQEDLDKERKDILHLSNGRAIKSVMVDLNGVAARITNDKDPEKSLVREASSSLRQLIASQGKVAEKLEADLAQFRKTFNDRVLYFRQLQEISDSVAEVEFDSPLKDAIIDAQTVEKNMEGKITTLRARQRYLDNLSQNQEDFNDTTEDDGCILCRCEFTTGYVTQCAHVFCERCLKMWLSRKEGKICPVCRLDIDITQLQRFSIKSSDKEPPPRIVNNEPVPQSRRHIQYNVIDDELFKTIESVESSGSYGSKIQTLVRHLLYLQMTEPEAKSIVFSAWADSLHIIEHALHLNGIPSLRIDQKKNKKSAATMFQDDPNIRVLLLHGERENAGLNIVCASRVFLVESVVNHAFEIQAIARIDRMGQKHDTQVYCYYAEDTVEKNILDLAARQGLSLYTKENSAGTLNVSNFTLDPKKPSVDSKTKRKGGQKGDFIFKTDDMLAILFPHMYEDIEYLVPEDDVVMDEPIEASLSVQEYINAEAGPSRLSG